MQKLEYRPDIDGLRTIAVLSVVLFHAGFSWIPGGYIGVDVFFVISGYLITSIIAGEIYYSGRFSFYGFYFRRIRRLFPALFATIIFSFIVASTIFSEHDYERLNHSSLAALFSLSNIFFWNESGYFDSESIIKPLLHTWSLSVEEQFYIIWPSVVAALLYFFKKWALGLVASIAFASFFACIFFLKSYPSAAFYFTPFRVYEFGIGAMLALSGVKSNRRGLLSELLFGSGILFIVIPAFSYDENTVFPGVNALFPCLGAALCIYAKDSVVLSKVITNKPAVAIGKISYSLYLVHWPIYVFYTYYIFRDISITEKVGIVFATFFAAVIMYFVVEAPMRKREFWSKGRLFYVGAAPAMFALSVSANSYIGDDDISAAWDVVLEKPEAAVEKKFAGCNMSIDDADGISDFCRMGDEASVPSVAVWGDSHASALSLGIDQILRENNLAGLKLTEVGCAPIVGVTREVNGVANSDCARFNDFVMQGILKDDNIDTVVLASRWTLQIESARFDNQEGGVEKGGRAILLGLDESNNWVKNKDLVFERFKESIETLARSGKKVVIVYPIPEVGWHVPRTMHHRMENGEDVQVTTSYDVFKERNRRSYEFLDSIVIENVYRFYPAETFCNSFVEERCVASLENTPLYSDDDHLSGYGSLLVARPISELLD